PDDPGWLLYPSGSVHRLRHDGSGLFHGSRAAELLPEQQWWRCADPVLLRVPVPGVLGPRRLERQQELSCRRTDKEKAAVIISRRPFLWIAAPSESLARRWGALGGAARLEHFAR